MKTYLIKGGTLVNEGQQIRKDILIKDGRIDKIADQIEHVGATEINADGLLVMPGVIDDQVHFREPGLTHKACIETEAHAAVAGGTTSFMEMPNTVPQAVTQELLADKYDIGAATSVANYSFFMGATNDNLDEVLKTNGKDVCGLKVFMGSSTGNMLVDNAQTLEKIFKNTPMLIATHCEDEATVRQNTAKAIEQYGEDIPIEQHPIIRDVEACYKSSSMAIELAKQHDARLHILHISTAKELELFRNDIPLAEKRITAEVCVHHLHFDASDYTTLGTQIKCNPAIKAPEHKAELLKALLDDRLDIIATDHAPHTWDEKQNKYLKAPSGVPLVQHSLQLMLEFYKLGKISLEKIVEKMCHAPAICFKLEERGYLREGYWADIVLVNPNKGYQVTPQNILHKCGWSPFTGQTFGSSIESTFVSGHLAFDGTNIIDTVRGKRLTFNR